ncbi:MAG: hypothetical protein WBJ19_09350 [Rhodoferax sp.]
MFIFMILFVRLFDQDQKIKGKPLELMIGCALRRFGALVTGNSVTTRKGIPVGLAHATGKYPSEDLGSLETT